MPFPIVIASTTKEDEVISKRRIELMNTKELKKLFHQNLVQLVDQKIETARLALASTQESKTNETKSSAGDKHETGRAMMQREEEQNRGQLAKALELKSVLGQMDLEKEYAAVEFGSLVMTNLGVYFLSIGLGEITVEENSCFAISPASPLGSVLLDKTVGDKVKFLGKEYEIEWVE